MISGIKTGNVDRAMYGFWGTAATLASVPRSAAGAAKEVLSEGFSYITGLPFLNPKSLFSKRGAEGLEEASSELLEQVQKKRTVVFAKPGSSELRYLDYMGADGNINPGMPMHILLRENPNKVTVMEEFLHGTQVRLGILDKLGHQGTELHVNEFMLRHKNMLKLTPGEVKNIEMTIEQINKGIF